MGDVPAPGRRPPSSCTSRRTFSRLSWSGGANDALASDEESEKRSPSKRSARVSAAAFVLPNAPIPPETPLETFAVPLAKLEAAAGLTFFRQGALGGEAREAFEASEREYFERRARGADVPAPRETTTKKNAAKTAHLCRAAGGCVLPAGFAAENPATARDGAVEGWIPRANDGSRHARHEAAARDSKYRSWLIIHHSRRRKTSKERLASSQRARRFTAGGRPRGGCPRRGARSRTRASRARGHKPSASSHTSRTLIMVSRRRTRASAAASASSGAVDLANRLLERLDRVLELLHEAELGFLARGDDVLVDHVHHGHRLHLHGADVVLEQHDFARLALAGGEHAHLLEELGVLASVSFDGVDAAVDAPDAPSPPPVRPLRSYPLPLKITLLCFLSRSCATAVGDSPASMRSSTSRRRRPALSCSGTVLMMDTFCAEPAARNSKRAAAVREGRRAVAVLGGHLDGARRRRAEGARVDLLLLGHVRGCPRRLASP